MNNMDQNTLNFIYFLAVIGGIWFIVHISLLVWAFLRMLFPRRNHLENYGANSWAVVTGASDGIGLAFCKELARVGFNVCLIARNARKLSDAENEIKEEHPHIETKVVIADFTHSQEEQFFERITDELKTIDVSLLVNNVGVSNIEELQNIGVAQIKQEINVNCVATACLTASIIPRMLSRPSKSGIINMSSSSGSLPGPYISNYSGSKAFVDMLSKGISLELEDKIDVLCVQPMVVETKMSQQSNRCDIISPEECARSSLDKLGYDTETRGHWKHMFLFWLVNRLPKSVINYSAKKSLASLVSKKSSPHKSQ